MHKKLTKVSVSTTLRLLSLIICLSTLLPTQAQSLLDGKKWTRTSLSTNGPAGGFNAGSLQGAAILNGQMYQFRTNGGTEKNTTYDIYNISTGTWTKGQALTCINQSHAGSGAFGTKVFTTSNSTYGQDCTIPFVYLTNGKTIQIVDIEHDVLVATWTLPALQDDAIAAYDFANGKLWSIGYVSGSRRAPYLIRELAVDFTAVPSDRTIADNEFASKTSLGGPDAAGIQHDLVNGTIQDCQYVDGKIYFCAGGGSSQHRTESCRVHVYDVTSKTIVDTKMLNDYDEAEGFVYDDATKSFLLTTIGRCRIWKLATGSGYDTDNFEPATKNGEYYEISNASQLLWFKQQVYGGCGDMKARLTADINMSGVTDPFSYYVYDYNLALAGKTTATYPAYFAFRGEFDGQNHTISNYTISSTPYYYDGLFPYCIGANIHDVTVKGSIKLSLCSAMVLQDGSWKAVYNQPVANVGLIGYMDGGTLENVNAFITIDETVAGVDGTINKLVGGEGSNAVTKTNCLTEDPALKTHAQNGDEHSYINGFCSLSDANASEEGYYQPATLVDGWYEIDNAGKMWWFANQILASKDNATYNAKVTKDIDMDGTNHPNFPGIGYHTGTSADQRPFSGNFDGQGHRIYNVSVTTKTGTQYGGGFIAYANGISKTIKDFTLEGTVTLNAGNGYAGGAIGYVDKGYTITGITSSVNITTKVGKTGGVVGFANTGSISKCRYNGTLTSSSVNIGGIAGETAVPMTDCLFDGKIVSTQTGNAGSCVGGIACAARGVAISNCLVYGTITTAVTGVSTSMVVGRADYNNLTLTNIYYKAKETSTPTIAYNANSKTVTATNVTAITTQSWQTIKTALNNSRVPSVWGIGSQVYPVPGDADQTQYTVTFNSNGGSECEAVTKVANSVITLPAPTKSGFLFTGWTLAADGSGTKYDGGANYTITDDVTLNAQWEASYTITFNSNGGSACEAVSNVAGTEITLPTPTKTGYLFNGWNTAEAGTGTSYEGGASYTITASTTLYAQWTEDEAGDYRNGFKKTGSKSDADYYEAPVAVTAENYASLGLTNTYVGYYAVKNAGNMFWIAKNLSAANNTRKYVMTDNINMAGDDANHKDWPGISAWGSTDTHFKGTFDGNGKKFTNYYMSVTGSNSWKAMFSVPNGATIKNFSVSGNIDISTTGTQIGTICGRVAGATTLEDIHSSVNITVAAGKTPASIGGLIGQCSAQTSFNRCRYSGTITGNSAYRNLGGIFGNAEAVITVNNCLFDGSISSTSTKTQGTTADDAIQIAGVGGRNNNKTTITNSLMIGTISVPSNSEAVDAEKTHSGIIFGYQKTTADLTITNTYYSTTGSTSGIRAVGLNSATNQSVAAPTEKTTQTWKNIKALLDHEPQEGDLVNWKMVGDPAWPIPMQNIEPREEGTYYTINFYKEDGTTLVASKEVLEGRELIAPAVPEKTGYAGNWSPALVSPVTANANYTATYTINSYTITYMNEGVQYAKQTYEYGATVTPPANPSAFGKDFNGWNPTVPATMPAEDLVLNAQFLAGVYQIYTVADLKAFRDEVNKAGGMPRNAKLMADIDCNNEDFGEPIGINTTENAFHSAPSNPYVGTFDGQGHWIRNININSASHFVGLFGYAGIGGQAGKEAIIKNFCVSGKINTSFSVQVASQCTQAHLGTIGCLMNGTIEGISSSVSLTNSSCTAAQFGGILGCTYQYASKKKLYNCAYTGTMTVDAWDCIGGVMGYSQGGVEIENCYFGGKIVQTCTLAKNTLMGGIIGYIASGTETGRAFPITNNVYNGSMTITTTGTGNLSGVLFAKQAGLSTTYIYGNHATSGTIPEGMGTVQARTVDEIIAQIFGYTWYKDPQGNLIPNNVISVDAEKNYVLRNLYFEDECDVLTDYTAVPPDAASIKVENITYKRPSTYMGGYMSVCFPFAVTKAMLPSDAKVYVYDKPVCDKDGYVVEVLFKEEPAYKDAIPAGMPVVVYTSQTTDWSINANIPGGTPVVLDPLYGITRSYLANTANATLKTNAERVGINGSFNTALTGIGYFKLNTAGDNVVYTLNTSHVYPFRVYIKLEPGKQVRPSGSAGVAPRARARFVDYAPGMVTDLNETRTDVSVKKYFKNNMLIIERNGVQYTADGQLLK